MSNIINITKSLINLKQASVIWNKVFARIGEQFSKNDNSLNLAWLAQNKQDFSTYAETLNNDLWQEALEYSKLLEQHSQEVLSKLDVKLGGGGFYPLIYFITRYLKPETILETGVAAGYSSHAFLSALRKNKEQNQIASELYSSDFPYFRLDEPEKYIGILVPEELQEDWHLFIDGDAKNLPQILNKVEKVDLFHYDSDKRYAGRKKAMELVSPKLAQDAIVIMDDIDDNAFFMELCQSSDRQYRIFEFGGKYIGLLGDLEATSLVGKD